MGPTFKTTILCVDDDPDVLKLIRVLLKRRFPACDVIVAENGIEALEQIKKKHIDLLLVDLVMPYMNGIQLCAHLGNKDKVIIVSACTREEIDKMNDLSESRLKHIITKPIHLQTFFNTIETIIGTNLFKVS